MIGNGNYTIYPVVSPPERVSHLELQRFFQVLVPMMAFRFGLAYAWYRWERRSIKERERPFTEKYLPV